MSIKTDLHYHLSAIGIALVFFAILFFIGSRPIFSHPDERHYVYGGIHMVQSGDWLFPRTPTGEIRLKKPILPYWFSAAGFKTLGINFAGSRLFWVMSAAMVLILTYQLARLLGGSPRTALFAELFLLGNPLFIFSSISTIPDMPLVLFSTIAIVALLNISKSTNPSVSVWFFWISNALAALSKGMLPIVFTIFTLLFLYCYKRDTFSKLISPAPLLSAIFILLSWYCLAYYHYPDAFIDQFFKDQITDKISPTLKQILFAIPIYSAYLIFTFIVGPFILFFSVFKSIDLKRIIFKNNIFKLLMGWCLLVIIIFSFSGLIIPRYLLPILPIISAVFALIFGEIILSNALFIKITPIIFIILILLSLILLSFSIAIHLQLHLLFQAILLVSMGSFVLVTLFFFAKKNIHYTMLMMTPLFIVFTLVFIVTPLDKPKLTVEVANTLKQTNIPSDKIAFLEDMHEASLTRLLLGHAQGFKELKAFPDDAQLNQFCIICTPNPAYALLLTSKGFSIKPILGGRKEQSNIDLLKSVFYGQLLENKNKYKKVMYLALKRTCV